MNDFEKLLTQSVQKILEKHPNRKVVLELSGGCDSSAIFFVLLNLNKEFEVVTYQFDKIENDDVKNAKKLCEYYNIKQIIINITREELLENLDILKEVYKIKGKVNLQTLACHYSIAKYYKDSLILNGSYADILYGSYRSIFMDAWKQNKIYTQRRIEMLNKKNADGTEDLRKIFMENNNIVEYPYHDSELINYFLQNISDVKKGKNKELFYKTFGDRIPQGVVLKRRSQQIVSYVRDYLKENGYE